MNKQLILIYSALSDHICAVKSMRENFLLDTNISQKLFTILFERNGRYFTNKIQKIYNI